MKKIIVLIMGLCFLSNIVYATDPGDWGGYRRALEELEYNIIPEKDNTVDIGSASKRVQDVYAVNINATGGSYSGTNTFTLDADEEVYIDATTTEHTDTAGSLRIITSTSTNGVYGIVNVMDINADIAATYGILSNVDRVTGGLTGGNKAIAFYADLTGDNNDNQGVYIGYATSSFSTNGGTSYSIAYFNPTGWTDLIRSYSGDISFGDYEAEIYGFRETDGNGNNLLIHAADGLDSAATNRNGGTLKLYGGNKANAGADGWVQIGSVGTPTQTMTGSCVYVGGKVEADGIIYADAGVNYGNETLTVYDEGTWTPVVTLGGAGDIPVYTTNTGRYTRIGRMVYVDIFLNGDGGQEGSGVTTISVSLPIAVSASFPGGAINCGKAFNGATEYMLQGLITASAIELTYWNAINSYASFTGADQNNTGRQIRLKFEYEV